jgi:uracil-DNA glycosylase
MFHTASKTLIYNDTMKMGSWKQTAEWGKGRSPDPILEFYDFCNQTISLLFKKRPTVPICDTLNDQNFFNGIGNYLRAEILYRAGLDPFQPTMDVFKDTPKSINFATFSGIIKETTSNGPADLSVKHDPGLMVFYLARQIPLEVITGDMNKYGTQDQQTRFKAWLRVYDKGTPVVQGSRKVHCTPMQRLGKQPRELGKLFDLYPLEVQGFYRNPTISFNGTKNPISSSTSSSSNLTASPTPATSVLGATQPSDEASLSGGFHQIKRVEENVLPCEKIVDLPIPMTSKLLMATTSLSRNGKLNFVEEGHVRSVIILGHPVAFSAWQVYEANADVDDLVDTLKRVAISPSAERMRQRALAIAGPPTPLNPSQNALSYAGVPTGLAVAAHVASSRFHNISGLRDDGMDLEPRKKKSASTRAAGDSMRSSHSGSSSELSSVSGDSDIGDEVMDSSPPSKKAKKKMVAKPVDKFRVPIKPSTAPYGQFGVISPTLSAATSSSSSSSFSSLAPLLTEKSWQTHLSTLLSSSALSSLNSFLSAAYAKNSPPVYPPSNAIFAAFNLCPLDKVKVVILGQDPYHGEGQAHGLCFSVQPPTPPPPSLVNIFKELEKDIPGFKAPINGDLTAWAKQGVFLLNTVLTVFEKSPNSHAHKGWEKFTDMAIKTIVKQRKGVVFMLWGKPAQKKTNLIDTSLHHVLNAAHPSPLSAFNGWFDCKHFSKANTLLQAQGDSPIDWRL